MKRVGITSGGQDPNFIGRMMGVLCLLLCSLFTFSGVVSADECSTISVPTVFGEDAYEKLQEEFGDHVFYSQAYLEAAGRGLYTYCCTSKDDCKQSEFIPGTIGSQSPSLYDQILVGVVDPYLKGDANACNDLGLNNCEPDMYAKYSLPATSVCFRNGSTESVGDARCATEAQVESGVDTVVGSSEGEIPGVIHGLMQDYFSLGIQPKREDLTKQGVDNLSYYQLMYFMCEELDFLYRNVLDFSAISLSKNGGDIWSSCLADTSKRIGNLQKYVKIGTKVAESARVVDTIQSGYLDHIFEVYHQLGIDVDNMVVDSFEMMKNRNQYTLQCTVA